MRDHLAALRARLAPGAAQAAALSKRALVVSKEKFEAAKRATLRVLGIIGRGLKRALLAVLGVIEAVLLSQSGRERIEATATFSLIFLFAIASVDFLISGGPEFGAPAQAAPRQQLVRVYTPEEVAAQRAPSEAVPTEVASSLASTRAANVVALSQSFPAARQTRAPSTRASIAPVAPLADAPAPEAVVEDAPPRKTMRVKDETSSG